jgi:two-component system, cell cycle response regulator DivK
MIDTQNVANWKVLVVDDEPDSLTVVTLVLKFHGATVYSAKNGKEALDLVEQVTPTFILSDLSMPEMDGWEMLHNLQSNVRTKDIPVIALTAHAMKGDRERAVSVGFHYYLTKPLSPITFLKDLTKLFANQPAPPTKNQTETEQIPTVEAVPAAKTEQPASPQGVTATPQAPPVTTTANHNGNHKKDKRELSR